MPTFRSIATDAYNEIGVLGEDEDMDGPKGAFALTRGQHMIDAWAADRLLLSVQTRTTFTLTSGTSSVTLGPSGGTVTMPRPVYINAVTYVIPGTSPAVESEPLGLMNRDQYINLSIKGLSSSLPMQAFYQTSLDTVLGTLFLWPTVNQDVTMVLYTPTAMGVPTTLDSILTGPPGWQDAFMYALALRLCTPFGVNVSEQCPLLPKMATDAMAVIKRVNVMPGLLGVDRALVPWSGSGYNVLTDSSSNPSNR